MTQSEVDGVIRMAWEDRTSFDEIEAKTGLAEGKVIKIMRQQLKPPSFRRWRARVSGRPAKHRKLLKRRKQGSSRHSSRHWVHEWNDTTG
ncbi:MAG: TIGR03643 family protein [Verrucomicrobiales bacterium]|nr:TIGR03643 family protein [Verrucomicrobiales bacterium]